MAQLAMAGVTKHYRLAGETVVALDGVDLQVDAGELVVIVGRSGSGKSTLLHLAAGLDEPDAGTIVVGGRELSSLNARARAQLRRRELGFVFQFFHLLPSMTVRENIEYPALLDGLRLDDEVDTLIERVGLTHRAHHLPSELSGGEMQRAALARALVARPKVVLADEPTGNLDRATGAQVLELLVEQARALGSALVMVTHDAAAAGLADRVLRLEDGHLR